MTTAINYKVVEERIDLEVLRQEKSNLEAQLQTKEPSEKELIEMGKMIHPYYQTDKVAIQKRLDEIELLLK